MLLGCRDLYIHVQSLSNSSHLFPVHTVKKNLGFECSRDLSKLTIGSHHHGSHKCGDRCRGRATADSANLESAYAIEMEDSNCGDFPS